MPRAALAAILLLASCAVSNTMQLRPGARLADGEAMAFGRILVAGEAGQPSGPPVKIGDTNYGRMLLAVVREGDAEAVTHEVDDGVVRWRLAPGRYQITAWAAQSSGFIGPTRWISGTVGANFELRAGAATYLGTLLIRFGDREPGLTVEDAQEAEVAALRPALPPGAEVTKGLFRLSDPEPAGSPDLVGGRSQAYGKAFRGVKPTAPDEEANTLRPTFTWELSPGVDPAGLTYDLRITRKLKIGDILFGWIYAQGPEIYRRTGLTAASHQVEQPLEWDRSYYWEVRLRRGDKVGPWSRHDASGFAGSSQRNIPFTFTVSRATPASP